jgi:hypothetical protein
VCFVNFVVQNKRKSSRLRAATGSLDSIAGLQPRAAQAV